MELLNAARSCERRRKKGKQGRRNIWMLMIFILYFGFDVWQMQTVSISPQSMVHFSFAVCIFMIRSWVFNIFPVFSVWFADARSLAFSLSDLSLSCSFIIVFPFFYPSTIAPMMLNEPGKCDYVAVCHHMW